jgi:hypothetical protein
LLKRGATTRSSGALGVAAAALGGAVLLVALSGCMVLSIFSRSAGYDARPLTLQTLSLFNQRTPTRLSKKSWKGDWMFRRDRLELVDSELRDVRPDVLMLQEVLARSGFGAESDRKILMAGSLADYEWRERVVEVYDDTNEQEAMAFALGVPLKFEDATPGKVESAPENEAAAKPAPSDGGRDSWEMGTGGHLMASTFDYEGQPVDVFNVQMPPQTDSSYLWYAFLQERVMERLKARKHCPKRVVIAGWMPGDEGARRFADFVRTLQIKDAAAGYCQVASNCFTATPTNDIFMATVGDESPQRTDRIFVHESAIIYSSGRNFEDDDASSRYAREFGLARLWPAQRFGWGTQVRLARCTADEIETAFR